MNVQRGVIAKWFPRGFGFIKSDEASSPDIFLHISDLAELDGEEPAVGDRVEFEVALGKDDRSKAVNVRLLD